MVLTVKEFMAKYKVSRTTIYRWMEKGMPIIKVGGILRFDEATDQWVKEQAQKEKQ